MSCVKKPKTDAEKRNKDIDKKLKKEKKTTKMTHRIPVVGAGESGKSTLLKQMLILYDKELTDDERKTKIRDIHNNVKDSMLAIIGAMKKIKPPVELSDPENQVHVDYIQSAVLQPNFIFNEEFFNHCRLLWQDFGVLATHSRANEFQLIDCAKYFLDKVACVSKSDYIPDNQDILRCRVLTSGIFETTFHVGEVFFHMYDVGGQRDERRKWIQVFSDVTAVIFVCACSAYDMTLRESNSTNRLMESVTLFKEIWHNRYLLKTSVILFLNKQDIFAEKIKSGKTLLETYFPDFINFKVSNGTHTSDPKNGIPEEPAELVRAKCFVKDLFMNISKSNDADRSCYAHYTTAIDTKNIERVFGDCQDMLRRVYMQKIGFI